VVAGSLGLRGSCGGSYLVESLQIAHPVSFGHLVSLFNRVVAFAIEPKGKFKKIR
jgi:hypothetical protein